MKTEPIEILLVEDNPDHIELVLDALQNNDVSNEVHVVRDGQAALDYLYQRGTNHEAVRPGLIMLDIKLPKIDGIDVLRLIKNDPALQTIPVVMLTTSGTVEDVQTSYQNGANSYIIKPVDFEKFRKAIREIKMYWLVCNRLPH
jgi:two-component system, response regulator